MTWHDNTIPADEIWLKLGGDKGHGSFKLNMQVVNTAHPNSVKNTTLLTVFKAGDSIVNLHTALSQYKTQIEELQGMQWRLKMILFYTFKMFKSNITQRLDHKGVLFRRL